MPLSAAHCHVLNLCGEREREHQWSAMPWYHMGGRCSLESPPLLPGHYTARLKHHIEPAGLIVPMEDRGQLVVIGQLNNVLFSYCYLQHDLWELTHLPSSCSPYNGLANIYITFYVKYLT